MNWEDEPTQARCASEGSEPGQDEIGWVIDTHTTSQRNLTQEERDSGTTAVHQTGSAELTGKLCR
jgi:hypothetical protein